MKHVHKALQIRQHKHTGKLLPHKHTSYGVLFVLMILPVMALTFVGHLVSASEYEISAKVPAIPPSTPPTIIYPVENVPIRDREVTIRGTCPVAVPPVIIAIYDGDTLLGSVRCNNEGGYALNVYLSEGIHQLMAKILSITGDAGGVSAAIVVEVRRIEPARAGGDPSPVASSAPQIGLPLSILPSDIFLTLNAQNEVLWMGKFQGGTLPYKVTVDWGDGETTSYDVANHEEQSFRHGYSKASSYNVTITMTDATGMKTVLETTAVTFLLAQKSILDTHFEQVSPVVAYIQKYFIQIYIITLFSLLLLWYLEHGRHTALHQIGVNALGARKKAHSGRRHR